MGVPSAQVFAFGILSLLVSAQGDATTKADIHVLAPFEYGGSPEELFDDEELIVQFYNAVLVVTVDSVTNGGPFTNGNPPVIQFDVIHAVKGAAPSNCLTLTWGGWKPHSDAGAITEAELVPWRATPIEAPIVGSTWIISGRTTGEGFWLSPRCRYWYNNKLERRIRFALENAASAKVDPNESYEDGQKRGVAEDVANERDADLEKLCEESTDVVIGTPGGAEVGIGSYVLMLHDCEHLLDSRLEPERDGKPGMRVDARYDARRMAMLRWHRYRSASLVFLKTSDHDTVEMPPQARASCDVRNFVFTDPNNGMLKATPERVEQVRAILARRACLR